MNLHLIAASHRHDSVNRKLLLHAGAVMAEFGANLQHHHYSAFDLPLYNDAHRIENGLPEAVYQVAELLYPSNALMLAVPEYNWSYPASFKNIIDWFSCMDSQPLKGKPVFLMCATPSERGGMMGLSHLKTVLEYMGMWVYPLMFGLGKESSQWEGKRLVLKQQKLLETQLAGFNDYCGKLGN
jgi:chromate reductase, NAD(P)H dehydrogenase (quinone)